MGSIAAELIAHPQSKSSAVRSINAALGREDSGTMFLMFRLEGDLSRIRSLEPAEPAVRADNLWQSTCFECFMRDTGTAAYREYNLAPSGSWAVYDFASYRDGMTSPPAVPPVFARESDDRRITLQARIRIPTESEARRISTWRVGLSAVIEETDGTRSYWALAHPPGRPDFHHPDCFTLELPPPSAP